MAGAKIAKQINS